MTALLVATWLSDLTALTTNPLLKEGGEGGNPLLWNSKGVAGGGGGGDKIRIDMFDSSEGIVQFDH